MRRLWLIFAQAVTVSLAILFVVTTLRPDWLRLSGPAPATRAPAAAASGQAGASYADAVARAPRRRWSTYTPPSMSTCRWCPLPDDPVLRQLFGQVPGLSRREASTSLGSG